LTANKTPDGKLPFFVTVHALGANEHQGQNAAAGQQWPGLVRGIRGVQEGVRGRGELGSQQNKMGRQVQRGHYQQVPQLRDISGVDAQTDDTNNIPSPKYPSTYYYYYYHYYIVVYLYLLIRAS